MLKQRIKIVSCIIALLIAQVAFWYHTKDITPKLGMLPSIPSLNTAKALSFGDEQFYFRMNALIIQTSGDSFGRFTALKDYDYELLMRWFKLFDELDSKTNFTPSIASYYYGNTQRALDTKYIIEYLESTYDRDPPNKWWWLGQAVYLANHRLKDKDLALRLAFKLSSTEGVKMPRWAEQMPAIIYSQMGRKAEALAMIQDLLERHDDYSQGEINYMNFFIRKQLGYLDEAITKEPKYKNVEPAFID